MRYAAVLVQVELGEDKPRTRAKNAIAQSERLKPLKGLFGFVIFEANLPVSKKIQRRARRGVTERKVDGNSKDILQVKTSI